MNTFHELHKISINVYFVKCPKVTDISWTAKTFEVLHYIFWLLLSCFLFGFIVLLKCEQNRWSRLTTSNLDQGRSLLGKYGSIAIQNTAFLPWINIHITTEPCQKHIRHAVCHLLSIIIRNLARASVRACVRARVCVCPLSDNKVRLITLRERNIYNRSNKIKILRDLLLKKKTFLLKD